MKNDADEDKVRNQFLKVLADVPYIKKVYRKLCSYFQVAYGEGQHQTFDFDYNTFCERYDLNPIISYNALLAMDRNSIISLSPQFSHQTEMRIKVTKDGLFQYLKHQYEMESVMLILLRTYGGLFEVMTKINPNLIANKLGRDELFLIDFLKKLYADDIIELKLGETDARITFIEPREDDKTINRISDIIIQQNRLKEKQVNAVLDYINDTSVCKQKKLLAYFGETLKAECGICSVCSARTKSEKPDRRSEIKVISEALMNNALSSRDIIKKTRLDEERVLLLIELMLEKELIEVTPTNTYKLTD